MSVLIVVARELGEGDAQYTTRYEILRVRLDETGEGFTVGDTIDVRHDPYRFAPA